MNLSQIVNKIRKSNNLIDIKKADGIDLSKVKIGDVTYSSLDVRENSLFICKGSGFKKEYLLDSLNKGIVAYISEKDYSKEVAQWIKEKKLSERQVICIIVRDIRVTMAVVANEFFQYPWTKIPIVAFGGTKGKSTATYIFKEIIDGYLGKKGKKESGIISSIEVYDGVKRQESHLTTPEALELQRTLKKGSDNGIEIFEMEVSSQALKYNRTYGMIFQVGAFLNMGYDHISPVEHRDFHDYFQSKMLMLGQCKNLVINLDTDKIDEIMEIANGYLKEGKVEKIITYSIKNPNAILYGKNIAYDIEKNKSIFTLVDNCENKTYEGISLNMMGDFNVSNAISGIATANVLGIPIEESIKSLDKVIVKGRMNILASKEGCVVAIVDYAHNKISFESLFKMIKTVYKDYEVVSVFGCPGGKALNRRKELGEVASRYADKIIIVPEDPNMEPTDKIANEILANIYGKTKNHVEVFSNREKSVETTLLKAMDTGKRENKKIVVAITGKGWETTMKINGKLVNIESDMDIAKRVLLEK